MAYQLAFDLESNATQKYLTKVASALTAESDEAAQAKIDKIKSILSGKETIKLQLEFLCRNNHTDMLILKNSKVLLASSLRHFAYVIRTSVKDLLLIKIYYSTFRPFSMLASQSTTLPLLLPTPS